MTKQERSEVIATMAENMNAEITPKLGIFWYDPKKNELFGVNKTIADDIPFMPNGKRTYRELHKNYWQRQFFRAQAKGERTIFTGDYTQIPRGRIFEYKNDGFKVMVGSWINDYPDDVRQMILDEFDLPENTEFIIDSHWDLGHGWSEENL